MTISLPDLPYGKNDLAPHISENTLNFHYGKHHNAYVDNLNKLIEGTDLAEKSLEDIILKAANDPQSVGIFNNAAQVWNHTFFWKSMTPGGGGTPSGKIAEMLQADLGGYEHFATILFKRHYFLIKGTIWRQASAEVHKEQQSIPLSPWNIYPTSCRLKQSTSVSTACNMPNHLGQKAVRVKKFS